MATLEELLAEKARRQAGKPDLQALLAEKARRNSQPIETTDQPMEVPEEDYFGKGVLPDFGTMTAALPKSIEKNAGIAWDAVTNLPETLKGLGQLGVGYGQKAFRSMTGDQEPGQYEQVFDDMLAELNQAYGSLPRAKATLESDPARVALDLLGMGKPSATGVADKAGRLGTGQLIPRPLARTMANRTLNIEDSMPTPARNRILETYLDEKTPDGLKGVDANKALNDPVRARIDAAIDALPADHAGSAPFESVLKNSRRIKEEAARSPQFRKQIQTTVEGLEKNLKEGYPRGPSRLTPRQLEELRRSNSAAADYSNVGLDTLQAQQNSVTNEYLKGTARDARNELVSRAPELDALYAEQGPRIEMNRYLDRAETATPRAPMVTGGVGTAGAGVGGTAMITGSVPAAVAAGATTMLVGTLLTNPRYAGKVAKALSRKTGWTAQQARKFLVDNPTLSIAEAMAHAQQRSEENQDE